MLRVEPVGDDTARRCQRAHAELASELIRAIRGKRSQAAFARRLGYRTNAVHCWEAGRNYPTAARALWAAKRAGIDVQAALERFLRTVPPALREADITTASGVSLLLDDLRGRTPLNDVAAHTGLSRFAISRVLKGQTEPRLPDFLRILEALSLRVLDFVAELVDPERLPSIAGAHRALAVARRAAHDAPLSQLVIRALELQDYAALPAHEPGFIARRLLLTDDEEQACLKLLAEGGLIRKHRGRWVVTQAATVDTRSDAGRAKATRAHWARWALDRLETGREQDAIFSYNLFCVSQQDYERLKALHRGYFRQLRAIVAHSAPLERVVLANLQLLPVDVGGS